MRRHCELAFPSWSLRLYIITYNNSITSILSSILQKDSSNYLIGCSGRSYGYARGDIWANITDYYC